MRLLHTIFNMRPYVVRPVALLVVLCALLLFLQTTAVAQEEQNTPAPEPVPELAAVVVTASAVDEDRGSSSFDEATLDLLPSGDGNVEDLLKLMPGVQDAEGTSSSFKAGEIAPPLLSISGGRPYQNNFLIDGLGNNSLIDPIEDNPHGIDRLPGHPEELFLNEHLIKDVTVYDHNVPARFGGFTGGVVDISTIDPADETGGTAYYRTTRDAWTRFHVDPSDMAAFVNSSTYTRQPEFIKHAGGFDLSLPVRAGTGVLLSYQFLYSKIPLHFLDTMKDQHRLNQNYLVKFVTRTQPNDKLSLQAIYSPYEGEYFTKDVKNGAFTLRGGGASLVAGYERKLGDGAIELKAGLRQSENSRSAARDIFTWTNSAVSGKDWGMLVGSTTSKEGGFGDLEISQKSCELTADWVSGVFRSGPVEQTLDAGVQWLYTLGRYDRDATSYAYRTSVPAVPPDPFLDCVNDPIACLPGDQYLSKRNVYDIAHARASLSRLALYLEDRFTLAHLELRPGLRLSTDNLMDNVDLAPRFSATYDLFGNGRSKLIGGWNRYFGDTLLTYKLREGIPLSVTEDRSTVIDNVQEWSISSTTLASDQFSKLKTPYADEIVGGFDQQVWGGVAAFRYIRRDADNEIARERDPAVAGVVRYSRLNNNGESHYEAYRLAWERHWPEQYLGLNLAYETSTSSNADYDTILLDADLDARIWYDGELLYPDRLPREDYNRPWIFNLIYSVKVPYGFTLTNTTRYRGGYRQIVDSGADQLVDGTPYPIYVEEKRPSSTLFDWRIDWCPPLVPDQALQLTVEIFNVFNRRATIADSVDTYELGRQVWAGLEYRF